jgi:hypothetical protein
MMATMEEALSLEDTDRRLAGEQNVDVEDQNGIAFPSVLTCVILSVLLYGLMLLLLMVRVAYIHNEIEAFK